MDSEPNESTVVATWREDELAIVAIRRPADANGTNTAVMRGIAAALDHTDSDPAVRVVALTGDRHAFSFGGRIDGDDENDIERQLAFARAFTRMQSRMATSKKPILAVVEGDCRCGGMSLLDACDVAIAADDVRFGFSEIDAGIFPFLAMASVYGRVSPKRAFDLFYSGRLFSAAEALELELVNRAVPVADIWNEARRYARELASRSAAALAIGRQTYYGMANMGPAARLEYAQGMLVTMLAARRQPA